MTINIKRVIKSSFPSPQHYWGTSNEINSAHTVIEELDLGTGVSLKRVVKDRHASLPPTAGIIPELFDVLLASPNTRVDIEREVCQ